MKKELTPAGILRSLGKCWWICTIVAIIFATGAFFYSRFNYREAYTSRAQIMVRFSSEDEISSATSAVQGANYAQKVLNTYVSILKSSNDFKNYLKQTYLLKYNTTEFPRYAVSFTNDSETQLVNVHMTAYKPEYAFQLCETFVECAPKYIEERTGKEDELRITDNATLPVTPSNQDNSARNTIIAALLGFLVPFAVAVVIDLFDVRILAAEDLRTTYKYPVLGEIPDFTRYSGSRSSRGRYGYSRGYGYAYRYGYNYGYGSYQKPQNPTEKKTGGK
ncbi:MAG: hypothetical protein IKT43_04485 [Clostridia bacterium]|nr:hypothetical protein [Clostridia bacterium]